LAGTRVRDVYISPMVVASWPLLAMAVADQKLVCSTFHRILVCVSKLLSLCRVHGGMKVPYFYVTTSSVPNNRYGYRYGFTVC